MEYVRFYYVFCYFYGTLFLEVESGVGIFCCSVHICHAFFGALKNANYVVLFIAVLVFYFSFSSTSGDNLLIYRCCFESQLTLRI